MPKMKGMYESVRRLSRFADFESIWNYIFCYCCCCCHCWCCCDDATLGQLLQFRCAIINGNYYSPRSSPRGLNPTRHKTGRRPRRKPSIRFSGVGAPAYQLRGALGGNRFTRTLSSSTIGMLKTVLVKKFPMRNSRVYCRQDSIRPLIHDSAEMVSTVS